MVVSKMSMLTFISKHNLPNIKMLYNIFMYNFFQTIDFGCFTQAEHSYYDLWCVIHLKKYRPNNFIKLSVDFHKVILLQYRLMNEIQWFKKKKKKRAPISEQMWSKNRRP